MSKLEEKLKKLENKIDQLSEQLRDTEEFILNANKVLIKASIDLHEDTVKSSIEIAKLLEKSRKKDEERKRRTERRRFFKGLIAGLALGIFGNLVVSSWTEYLKAFGMPSWGWALGVVVGLLALAYIAWQFDIEIKKA